MFIRHFYLICFILILFIINPAIGQDEPPVGPISGERDVCPGQTYSYHFSGSEGFKKWLITGGTYTLMNGTTVNTNPISVRWNSSATIDVLTVRPPSGNFDITVTFHPTPSLNVSGKIIGKPGEEVTLTASGALSYFWTGPGLITNTGPSVNAILPSEEDFLYTVTGSNGFCSVTKSIAIQLVLIDAGPDRTYCKDVGAINLADWGLSLTEGSWSGPAISGDQIDINSLTVGDHVYTYTRASDGADDSIILTATAAPNPGSIILQPTSSCGILSGTLYLGGFDGVIKNWEKSYNGSTWEILSSTSNAQPYNETQKTYFRAAVERDGCTAYASVTVETIEPIAGTISTQSISITCTLVTGSLSITGSNASVVLWEKSYDNGNNWITAGNAVPTLFGISESKNVSFRATVKKDNCSVIYTDPVELEPLNPIAGNLAASSINYACDNSSGQLELHGAKGTFTWEQKTETVDWMPVAGATGTSLLFNVNENIRYRVKVEKSTCTPVYTSEYKIDISTKGGVAQATTTGACGAATGYLSTSNSIGTIKHWEHSTDGLSWQIISGSQGISNIQFTTDQPSNYYKALIQLNDCDSRYSDPVSVVVNPPTVPGAVKFINETNSTVNGKLTFHATFRLQNYDGSILNWLKEAGTSEQINNQTDQITVDLIETSRFRAHVQKGECEPLLSGSALFVVNKSFSGVIKLSSGLVLNSYDGNSYQIKTDKGISLQDGFSFVANSGQDFFILLDDNYDLPPQNENYMLTETIQEEGITDENDIFFATPNQRTSTFTYVDGLGRASQGVQHKASPLQTDIVSPVEYDNYGRKTIEYLPFVSNDKNGHFKKGVYTQQRNFYTTPPEKVASSSNPYAIRIMEPSPLNRVDEQGAFGTEWQPGTGHTIKMFNGVSAEGEVKYWIINPDTQKPEQDGFYQEGELSVNIIEDEHGSQVREYANQEGQVILKRLQKDDQWLETAFLFDKFGLLRFVIQPEGMAILDGNPSDDFLDSWAFQYKYDGRKRPVEVKVPGAEARWMVYDERDRLVMTQDGNQRAKAVHEWIFTKYDVLNRPVFTGIYKDTDNLGREAMQNNVNDFYRESNDLAFYEQRGGVIHGYTNRSFPDVDSENDYLTVMYYDDYAFVSSSGSNLGYDKEALTGLPVQNFEWVNGLLTGSKTKILATSQWIRDVYYYDKYSREIQRISINDLQGTDRVSKILDFVGRPQKINLQHSFNGKVNTILEEFFYDHRGRVTAHYHQLDNNPRVLLKQQKYNLLGELIEKNLHEKADGSFFQSVDYRYNIRGWLTHINNAQLANDQLTNDDANDFFGFELKYNNPTTTGGPAQFNGNISEALWKSFGSSKQSYGYAYDALNRFKEAKYFNLSSLVNNGRFNESVDDYDRNGNILKLQRNGSSGLMDNLAYTYSGNQLLAVTDSGLKDEGFKDGANQDSDYAYNRSGSMTVDKNKDIKTIQYNHLNLPEVVTKVTGEKIEYIYDARGVKLSQKTTENNVTNAVSYAGPFIYENDALQFILTEEGRVGMTKPEPQYDYFLKDHLGNVRIAFTTKEETEEFLATLDNESEDRKFLRYDNVRKVKNQLFDKTKDGTDPSGYAIRLSGGEFEKVGLAKSLQILPGDKVHMEVYAKYVHPDDEASWSNAVAILMNMFVTGTLDASIVDGSDYTKNTNNLPFPTGNGNNSNSSGPKAYLNYVFLNKDFDLSKMKMDVKKLSAEPRETGQNIAHEKLELEFEATEAGFLYVYFSNDNEEVKEEVFFDDFSITHTKSLILQETSYYPFGMTAENFTRENIVDQAYLYNGKERQKVTGWLDYGARMYQPELGRFFTQDRFADKYFDLSPYGYAANNPVKFIDVNGDSLWINSKDGKLLYENGKLYSKGENGFTEYKGSLAKFDKEGNVKGYKGILGATVSALNKLSTKSEFAERIISSLVASENNFFIKPSYTTANYAPVDLPSKKTPVGILNNNAYYYQVMDQGELMVSYAPFDKIGSGGHINWNPRTGIIGLGHELGHSFDANAGMLDSRLVELINGKSAEIREIRAVYYENRIRQDLGKSLRKEYLDSWSKLVSSTGQPIFYPTPYLSK